MYVAVKGGERAIDNAHALLAEERRGDQKVPELTLKQIQNQMSGAVDRVMTEGSVYDPELAALAIKQACGDLVEAIFLLRNIASICNVETPRHECNDFEATYIGDLQGPPRWPVAGPDVRLYASIIGLCSRCRGWRTCKPDGDSTF